MRVFGLGLSRTGTTSLTAALNLLGIKTIHGPHDSLTQEEFRNANYRLSILDQYQGITDIPAAMFYAQFDEIYPGSKFILTVRDIDSWLKSMKGHYERTGAPTPWKQFIRTVAYGTTVYEPRRLRFVYEQHARNVTDYFKDRVLVMNAAEGWKPLCEYLGVEVPGIPFPHENSGPRMLLLG